MKLSLASLGEEPTPRFLEQVRLAELLGFRAFFHADEKWTHDVYSRVGAAAVTTSRIGLGIAATDPYTRHPALTAQATATLAEMAPSRFTVVLGAGSHYETLGLSGSKPVAAIREAAELMRRLWDGERVTMEGEVVKFHGGRLDFLPSARPEVWVAARGPRVFQLAGEIAEGAMVGSFATPTGIEYAKRNIELGLERSGRDWSQLKLVCWIYVSLLDAEDEPIPDNIRRGVGHALWSSRKLLFGMLDELAGDITDEFRTFMRDAPHVWSPEVMGELRRLIPRGLFDSLAIAGTAAQVVARIAALEAAGVDEIVIWPFPREGEDVERLISRLGDQVLPAVSPAPERAAYELVD